MLNYIDSVKYFIGEEPKGRGGVAYVKAVKQAVLEQPGFACGGLKQKVEYLTQHFQF